MAVKDTNTRVTLDKHACYLEQTRAQVENLVASVPFTSVDVSDLPFMDGGSYFQAGYSTNHVTSKYRHL